MSVTRACGVLTILTAVAIAAVHMRVEQTRCAARLLSVEADRVQIRRELWETQARAARLRSPQRVHDRLDSGGDELVSPLAGMPGAPSGRLVADRPRQ